MTVQEISPGVHLFVSHAWQMSSLVLRCGKVALLVDPGYFPDEVSRQLEVLAAAAPAAPALLLTHGDFDHVAGAAQLPPLAPVVGHASLLRRRPAAVAQRLAAFDSELYVARPGPFAFPFPTQPVAAPLTLDLGDERLHLYPAPGHTADSLFTLCARRGLLLAGDYLSDLEFPFIEDSLPAYRATLDLAAALIADAEPRLLVPGHGPIAEGPAAMRARVSRDRQYLDDLAEGIDRCVAEGLSLPETQRRLASLRYRGEPVADHLRGPHKKNVARVYRAAPNSVAPPAPTPTAGLDAPRREVLGVPRSPQGTE